MGQQAPMTTRVTISLTWSFSSRKQQECAPKEQTTGCRNFCTQREGNKLDGGTVYNAVTIEKPTDTAVMVANETGWTPSYFKSPLTQWPSWSWITTGPGLSGS